MRYVRRVPQRSGGFSTPVTEPGANGEHDDPRHRRPEHVTRTVRRRAGTSEESTAGHVTAVFGSVRPDDDAFPAAAKNHTDGRPKTCSRRVRLCTLFRRPQRSRR